MRLTLRTLLAYLDGVLPAADQADLATRVGASAVAQSLVARIRQVTRQPAIGAPRLEGRGLGDDVNSVAEYLDNTLEPVRLETFERICLESDVHLAEIASCHAILAEVARDPAAIHDLDDAGRQRLLRAVRQQLAPAAARSEMEEARANAAIVRAAVQAAAEEHYTVFMPDAAATVAVAKKNRSRGSWMAWVSAAAALLLLISLGSVLVWSVASRGTRTAVKPQITAGVEGVATTEIAVVVPPPEQPSVTPPAPETAPAAPPPDESPLMEESAAVASPFPESPAPPPLAAQPIAGPAPGPAPGPAAESLVPNGDALAIAAVSPAAPAPPGPAAAVEPPAPPGFVGAAGLVLHRAGEADWAVLPAGAALAPRERLVAPPGFHSDINIGGVAIRLVPGTEAVTSLDDDGTPRIEIIRGRIVARASRADARLGITAAALTGTVTAGLTAPIAVVVDVHRAAGVDPSTAWPRMRAELFTTSGPIGWRQRTAHDAPPLEGIGAEGMLEARSAIVWDSSKPTLVKIAQYSTQPDWVAAAPAAVDAVEKRAGEALAAKVRVSEPLIRGLRELATDRRAENRAVAVSTLALLGEYDDLVELLCAEEPGRRLEAKQWAALEGQTVPLALTRGADHAAALRHAFVTHGPHGKGELLDTLARGFDDEALAAGGDRTLVEALDDPALVVRRYAIKNIIDIVEPSATDRLRYRADGLPELRREGAEWWRGQLEKGLIRRSSAR